MSNQKRKTYFKDEIKKKPSGKYDVYLPIMIKLKIKIENVSQELEKNDISRSVVDENNLTDDSVNVTFIRKDTYTIFCDVPLNLLT